jgi:hypothetical protein
VQQKRAENAETADGPRCKQLGFVQGTLRLDRAALIQLAILEFDFPKSNNPYSAGTKMLPNL